jgi:hypothetical protein
LQVCSPVGAVAAIPCVGLIGGAAVGLAAEAIPDALLLGALAISAAAGVWAWYVSRPGLFTGLVACAFFAGGALLATDAWRQAWQQHPARKTALPWC